VHLIPPDNAALLAEVREDQQKMEAAPSGSFVSISPDKEINYPEVRTKPSKVVILIDAQVASSAEQFLLEARESSKVTFIGEKTFGALDYGDVRPFPLLTGNGTIWIPTSRSRRLPAHPIDGIGIQPDISVLPQASSAKNDAVLARAVEYLERN
jgi:C-terminal processing protease CtpA/Prc